MQPYLKIIEEPQQHYRFRYNSEKKYPHIYGVSSNKEVVTYPTVELLNYEGQARIKCELYQVDKDERHFYEFIQKDQENVTSTVVPNQGSYRFCFREKAIVSKTKKEIQKISRQKYKSEHPDYDTNQIEQLCQKHIKGVELNKFRLKFSALDLSNKVMCSIYSQPIQNMRHTEVQIKKINEDGFEVVLGKGNIVFVHHSYGLIFRTPPYLNPDITEPVKVFIQLVRTTDGSTSNKIEYTYTPSPNNYRKRKFSRKEVFSKFFHQTPTSTQQMKQSNILTLPNVNPTCYTDPIDTVKNNTNQISNSNCISIQMNQNYLCNSALTPPNSLHNEGANEIISDYVAQNDLDCIQLCENGFIFKERGSSITINYDDKLPDELYKSKSEMTDWLPEENDGIRPTFDQLIGQNNILSPPTGVNYTEYQEFTNIDLIPEFKVEDLFSITLKPDGGGTKEIDPNKQTKPLDFENENKTEPSAFFNPQDFTKVKKLIKEIYENLRIGRKCEVKDTLEELCEIRLTDGGTFLHMMIDTNQEKFEIIVNLISSMKMLDELNSTNDFGQSILHAAIMNKNPRLTSFLVAKGCDPMLEDYQGNNAIHYGVKYKSNCLEHLLIAIKENSIPFDVNARNFEKQTALHLAAMNDSARSTELLLVAGADTRAADAEGRAALHLAAYDRCVAAAAALLLTGYVDEVDSTGRTALQIVCGCDYTDKSRELVKLLLRHEADPFKPSNGKSAVDYAKANPHMWETLKDELLEVNIPNSAANESDEEFFSADEDLNESEDITTKLQEMTLKEDSEIQELK